MDVLMSRSARTRVSDAAAIFKLCLQVVARPRICLTNSLLDQSMPACCLTQRTASSCVPNQTSDRAFMCSINSRNTTILER